MLSLTHTDDTALLRLLCSLAIDASGHPAFAISRIRGNLTVPMRGGASVVTPARNDANFIKTEQYVVLLHVGVDLLYYLDKDRTGLWLPLGFRRPG